jgi:type IV pilus assembly protein PilA
MLKIKPQGFTLIEVLLVIAILAILASITIMAINPGKQLAKARDSQRSADVHTILNAIHQYALDNAGAFPEQVDSYALEICRTDRTNCDFLADLSVLTDDQIYLVGMPRDPRCHEEGGDAYCSINGTGYFVEVTETGRITVSSQSAETEEYIFVTR